LNKQRGKASLFTQLVSTPTQESKREEGDSAMSIQTSYGDHGVAKVCLKVKLQTWDPNGEREIISAGENPKRLCP